MTSTQLFIVYNYLSAIFIMFSMISFSIGFSPFTENIINKSWTRNRNAKNAKTKSLRTYLTIISLLLLQLMMFCLIVFVLVKQHDKVDMLISKI